MVVAIVAGLCVGVLSFMPLVFGLRMARNASPTSNLGHAGALLLGVLLSFVILAVCLVVCLVAFRDVAVPFAVAEAGALIVFAVVYGFKVMVRKEK